MTLPSTLARTLATLASLAPAALVAGTIEFSGTVSWGHPSMGNPLIANGQCTGKIGERAWSYRDHAFSVDATGVYAIREHLEPYHLALYVYKGRFDPSAPAANCIAAGNGSPVRLSVPLEAGVPYIIVVAETGWDGADLTYRVSVDGPGTISGPCAGFLDVAHTDPFCGTVEWARNRGLTNGCTATWFCPAAGASRLALVTMLSRFATSIEPEFLVGVPPVPNAPLAAGILCQTPAYAVARYPRVATVVSAMFRHRAPVAVEVGTYVAVLSEEGHWRQVGEFFAAATNPPDRYATQSPASMPMTLQAGRSVRFGILVAPAGALAEGSCALTVRLDPLAIDPLLPASP